MRVRHTGTTLGHSEWSSDIPFVTRDQFSIILGIVNHGINMWQRIDSNFNPITTTTATFNSHPVYAGIVEQNIDGQLMIKIPAFYAKTGVVPSGQFAGKKYWMISDEPATGFTLHPAFYSNGAPIDQIYIGKYQGSLADNKMCSVANVYPI